MKSRTALTEKQLRRAARMAEEYQMSHLPQETAHEFSEKFERDMAILLQRFANGHVKTDRIRYGWRYYAKRSIVAVLLGAILTCIAMPEAVVAGYNRIIEVVERFVLDDARAIDDEYTNINAATDFVADAEYLYYQGKEGEIYRRPLANLTADSERLQLMTVDENYIFEDYAVGTLEEQSGHVYLYYYTGGAIMGSGHQFLMHPDGTVENVFHGKYDYFDFGNLQVLVNLTVHSLMPEPFTVIDKQGERTVGDEEYFYRSGRADDVGVTLGNAQMAYWNDTLYALAFRYWEQSHICTVNLKTGKTVPISHYPADNFELSNGKAYYACSYRADGTEEEDPYVEHLYMLNVKNGKETYVGAIKGQWYTNGDYYEPAEHGVYYYDCQTEALMYFDSKKQTHTTINTGAKVTKLYRENDYVVAHFDQGTAGCARLMVFDKTGTVYRSDEISDRATINENGVMIYRIAGTSQLVKAELR